MEDVYLTRPRTRRQIEIFNKLVTNRYENRPVDPSDYLAYYRGRVFAYRGDGQLYSDRDHSPLVMFEVLGKIRSGNHLF